MTRSLRFAVLILSGLGFLNALYLALEHISNSTPLCIGFSGCGAVLTSPYAFFWGVPLAYIGLVFYAALFLFSLLFFVNNDKRILFVIAVLVVGGVGASLVLFYIQAVLIGAFCTYCVISEVIIAGLAIILIVLWRGLPRPTPCV